MMKRLQSIRAIFNRVPTQLIMTTDNDFYSFQEEKFEIVGNWQWYVAGKYLGISLPYYASDKIYV